MGCSGSTPSILFPQTSKHKPGDFLTGKQEEDGEEDGEADFVQGIHLEGNHEKEGMWKRMEEDGSQDRKSVV